MARFSRWQDLILPIGLITSILVILVPMPAYLMDVLLAANITISVIVLLTTIYVRTPLEFNIFPSLLLLGKSSDNPFGVRASAACAVVFCVLGMVFFRQYREVAG